MDQAYDPRLEQPPPIAPETPLTATLTAAEWNVVQAALGELPMKFVRRLSENLERQLYMQANRAIETDG